MRTFALTAVLVFTAGLFCAGAAIAEQPRGNVLIQVSADQLNTGQVRELQRALKNNGIDPGAVDGTMGPLTSQGIEVFQARQGLAVTGNLDEQTLTSLGLDSQEFLGRFGEQESAPGQAATKGEKRFAISLNLLNSAQVLRLQQQLKASGIDPGPVDGIPGPRTRSGVRTFQQRQGLASTGNLNNQTLNALDIETEEFMGLAPAFE